MLTELLRLTQTEITTVVENINIEIRWASLVLSSQLACVHVNQTSSINKQSFLLSILMTS